MSRLEIRGFEAADLARVPLQPALLRLLPELARPGYGRLLTANGSLAWTGLKAGRVVGLGGLLELHRGSARAWTLLDGAGLDRDDWKAITRAAARALGQAAESGRWWRLEAEVVAGYRAGRRWAELLGFRFEGLKWGAGADGADVELYAVKLPSVRARRSQHAGSA